MKKVYGYIRVSTVKQGTGVSLQEQKEAIIRYAEKNQLNIIEWFEEQETAAKQGRPLFNKMMQLLKDKKANGVIIHKIDRGTRNYRDWASIDELIASGCELHFAHESLDMNTRAGRLTADMLVALATDYIRNLREEAIKGLYGRLKQGLYPFYAPIGYINTGGGQIKTLDKIRAPLVKKAFELYASGKYNLETLTEAMKNFGLRNSKGNFIHLTAMALILHNPFYTGVMKIKGKTFQGKHEPLISPKLFINVQNILKGKTNTRIIKHDFVFSRRIKCVDCGYSLIAETRKEHTYYRCQTKECPTKSIREELIYELMKETLEQIKLQTVEDEVLNELLEKAQVNWLETQKGLEESLQLQGKKLDLKLERLTDAYLESVIGKGQFEDKKGQIMIEQQELRNKEGHLESQKEAIFKKAKNFLGLLKDLKKSFIIATNEEKRKILKYITSDLTIQGKNLMITMQSPFHEIANRPDFLSGELKRETPRTKLAELAICFCEGSSLTDNNHSCGHQNTNTIQSILPEKIAATENQEIRERMQGLLDLILKYCEIKIDNHDLENNFDELL
ncbi:MAG: recombinase family protein [Saprospiraceae bacterium]